MTTDLDLESILLDPDKEAEWIETLLTIQNELGEVVVFHPTLQQHMMLRDSTGRDIRVKARQTRASSLIMARNVRRMTTQYGLNCAVITQTDQMTQVFRERIRHHLTDLAERDLKYEITKDNEDMLELGRMHNRFYWGSAQQSVGPRGIQTAHIIHCSEVAYWPEERAKTILGALIPACPPPPYGWFDLESTPNGAEGQFYDKVMEARPFDPMSKWTVHFYPWWLEKTYTIESYQALYNVQELLRDFHPTAPERELMAKYDLTPAQILWRRIQTADLLKTGKYFAQEYPEDLAKCFLTAGGGYFADPEFDHIGYYQNSIREPMYQLSALPWNKGEVNFRSGLLDIWEPPVPGNSYVVWLDAAAGFVGAEEKDSDYNAITVLDAKTRHHVATLRVRATAERAGEMVCAVGQHFNMAYLGIERNGPGAGGLAKALELNYPNLYYDVINQPKRPEPGWWTSEGSRDRMVRTLRESVFSSSLTTYDKVLVMEMGAFTWAKATKGFRPEARAGQHDDVLMSLAGCLTIAPYAPVRRVESPVLGDKQAQLSFLR